METQKSSFSPVSELTNKSNFKRYLRIKPDGSIFERIFLDIPDPSLREQTICFHYLQNYVRLFVKQLVGFNIISRDAPWDFKIEIIERETFNIEITSIADHQYQFEKIKREERLEQSSYEEQIPLHELEKINKIFPDPKVTAAIEKYKGLKTSQNDLVANPYHHKLEKTNLLLGVNFETGLALEEILKEAIQKKENKKHTEKEDTVLIIDNRTMAYEISDLHQAAENLEEFLMSCSFREIWFYTGYYTELDGTGGEYSFVPLITTNEQSSLLAELANSQTPDENGVVFVGKNNKKSI